MKIAISVRILNTPYIRGWSRYTYNLIHGLSQRNISLCLLSDTAINEDFLPPHLRGQVQVQQGRNYLHWEQVVLPKMVKDCGADLLHSPINYGVPVLGRFKKILTIHDAIDRSYYEPQMGVFNRWTGAHLKSKIIHTLSHRAADRVITVSEFSKKQIGRFYGISRDKIDVIYESADAHFSTEAAFSEEELLAKYKIKPGYFFYVGGLEKRKNIELLLAAARCTQGSPFVIAGAENSPLKKNAPNNVRFIGYVDDQDLPSLYFHSKAFIYPSFEEGFGLQLVESIKMGRPVVYARGSSLEEIYGTSKFSFDPMSVESLVAQLKGLEDNYLEAVAWANKRQSYFDWSKTITETIKVYESTLL